MQQFTPFFYPEATPTLTSGQLADIVGAIRLVSEPSGKAGVGIETIVACTACI